MSEVVLKDVSESGPGRKREEEESTCTLSVFPSSAINHRNMGGVILQETPAKIAGTHRCLVCLMRAA
jgi:hypothetical protein